MNNHDSIKWFLNIQFFILIGCFSIVSIVNIIYAIKSGKIYFRLFWNPFLLYMIIDFMISINDESELFFEKKHFPSEFRVSRVKRIKNV